MIKSSRRVFVVGGHITKFIGARHPDFIHKKHPDFGKKENPDLEYYVDASVNKTLEATGVQAEVIDKAWIGNFAGELFSKQVYRYHFVFLASNDSFFRAILVLQLLDPTLV